MIHSRPPEDVPIRLLATHLSQLVHSSVLTSIKNLTDSDSGILSDENNRSEWSDVDNPSVTDLTPPHTITDYRLSLAPTSGLLVLVIGPMLSFSTPFEFHAGYLNVLSPGCVGGGSCEDGPAEGILSAHSDWCHRQENQSAGTCPTQHTANTPSQRNTNYQDHTLPFSVISYRYSCYSDVYSLYFIISPFLKESYINEQLHYSFSSLTFSSDWAGRLFYCCSQKTNFSTFTAKPPPPFPHLHCPNHH